MITFTEQCGYKKINWLSFFRKKLIKEEEWEEMEGAAFDWQTCPVGSLDYGIARKVAKEELGEDELGNDESFGEPYDLILARLGGVGGFTDSYAKRDKEGCINLVKLINLRGEYLVKKMEKDKAEEKKEIAVLIKELQAKLEAM